ncbi:MAG: hypothetical protein FWF63_01920 [Fibromonadales bacterium]|nr:hypothetical protein [Fibromonadales bacterium]
MFKKIFAIGVVLALSACSSIDEDTQGGGGISSGSTQGGGGSSSSSIQGGGNTSSDSTQGGGDDISSSSEGGGDISSSSAGIASVTIATNGEQSSEMFKTFHYTFSLKASAPEDLTPFWNVAGGCSVEKQDAAPDASCRLDMTNAILQHKLTNQYSPLHYDRITTRIYIDGSPSMWKGITLNQWNLTGEGDEAALGLNVSEKETDDITDAGITSLNKVVSFEYKYAGGAHEFRLGSKKNGDFWYYEVKNATPVDRSAPESIQYTTVKIPISELKGMGSYAASDSKEETPFDISKVAKFLWAVKHKGNAQNDKGTLVLYDFKAYLE